MPLLKKWLLRAPPNVGARVSAICPSCCSLGRDMVGLSLAETRIVHDFAVRSAADILDRHFKGDLAKALFGFDGVVGNFASPYTPGTAYVLLHHLFGEAAGVPGAWGHAIGGMGSITQAMARACREAGVDILLNTPVEEVIVDKGRAAGVVAGGKAWRAQASSPGSIPSCCSTGWCRRARSTPTSRARMHDWKCESATFRMNVALSELPKFTVLPKKGNHLTAGIIMAPSLDYMHRAYRRCRGERLGEAADHRDADPLDARPDASRPRASMSRRCSASISATTSGRGAAGTRSARRRPTRSSPRSIAMRRASPSRCSAGRSIRRSTSSAASG